MRNALSRIATIGNYEPRQCGIATFTTDLSEALAEEFPDTSVMALPVTDTDAGYNYPPRVRFELIEKEIASYRRAADLLNISDVEVVCLQHEFGIFGGPAGSHIIALLKDLRMPVVTTLHTVLKDPDPQQRKVMEELSALSDRFVVMSEMAKGFLEDIYNVAPDKVDMIHHGIPDVAFIDPNFYKDKFGVEGQTVMLTFGLLAPNKGIEYAIRALPRVIEKLPDTVYIVLGATHPALRREQGETYRLSLQQLAESIGVTSNVIFHNRFITLEELVEFIGCADIYVTPYLNEAQITSGTLAYSVGAGKAVISTPYWYAQELLDDGRGALVPFKDSDAIAEKTVYLLENPTERHAMRKKAYQLGRDMTWAKVAQEYMAAFVRAGEERFKKPRSGLVVRTLDKRPVELPPVNLEHVRRMTDQTGILRHALFTVPDYGQGYTLDDNARALVLSVQLEGIAEASSSAADKARAAHYLAFLQYAFDSETGQFRPALTYARKWVAGKASDESHARALWALGMAAGRSHDAGLRALAVRLFSETIERASAFRQPRPWAYTLIGIHEFLRRYYGHRGAQDLRQKLAEKLLKLYKKNAGPDWPWFERSLTYSNAILPHALMLCGQWLGRPEMTEAALEALTWLMEVYRNDGTHFVPIGSQGYYPRGGKRARFDQHPVEAQATVAACLQAFRMTGEREWHREAKWAFEWFLGRNDLNTPLYNANSGGCFDSLDQDRVNQNQGAESTLAFLLALAEMIHGEHIIEEPAGSSGS